ncbi:MAG: hypothetical protein ABMB14_37775 [Myxococcota bacterium]
MADVQVKRGTVTNGKIERLVVGFDRLPDRVIDRDTAVRWMTDGHSFVPVRDGIRLPALQLVQLEGDGTTVAIRTDNAPVDEDRLPPLPTA